MQIEITRAQAKKASISLFAMYNGKNDPDVEKLLPILIGVFNSISQPGECICGAPISTEATGQIPEYCSERCRQQTYRERNQARRRKAVQQQNQAARWS